MSQLENEVGALRAEIHTLVQALSIQHEMLGIMDSKITTILEAATKEIDSDTSLFDLLLNMANSITNLLHGQSQLITMVRSSKPVIN